MLEKQGKLFLKKCTIFNFETKNYYFCTVVTITGMSYDDFT